MDEFVFTWVLPAFMLVIALFVVVLMVSVVFNWPVYVTGPAVLTYTCTGKC